MLNKYKMRKILDAIKTLRDEATDEQAERAAVLYPEWQPGQNYVVNERILFQDVLYKVLQNHTSQETWEPAVAPSLFAKVLIVDPTVITPWEQPDSTNPYMTGDKVSHNGKNWVSNCDNNVWEPGVYGWDEITE
jgi:hypothetical protein